MGDRLRMFPLGTVLLPGSLLPLHVFEPRYRQMMAECLDEAGEFGVALITRGREAGGGDERSTVATIASILQHEIYPDGRMGVLSAGTRRVKVIEWLPDDPYPHAIVEEWPDDDVVPGCDENVAALERALARTRAILELAARLEGVEVPETEISPEPEMGSYHLAALAPIGPFDRFRLLNTPGTAQRLAALAECLDDAEAALHFRLGGPG